MLKVLITGANGFIGRNIALKFSKENYYVVGIGHGDWIDENYTIWGLKEWHKSTISIESILEINLKFDLIIHCGGSGSVKFSWDNPYLDFQKTVQGTIALLEYIRLYNCDCKLIYPSSPAVQGNVNEFCIKEEFIGFPVSPYGYNKKLAEDLCVSYNNNFGLSIGIIRLFSVYGNGLKKQLLWDACNNIVGNKNAEFFGTGDETRDFIHISDVANLIFIFANKLNGFQLLNGGSGNAYKISTIVSKLASLLNTETLIIFNNSSNIGNPTHFCADISKALSLGWNPIVDIENGLKNYVDFFKKETL